VFDHDPDFGWPVEVLDTEPPVIVTEDGEVYVVGGPQIQLPGDGGLVVPRDARVANGLGAVVGLQRTTEHGERAAMWSSSGMTLLAPDWPFDTNATAIAGYFAAVNYELGDVQRRCQVATLHIGGSVTKLDPTASSSLVRDVNSYGIAVGQRSAGTCAVPTLPEGVVWVHGMHLRLGDLVGMEEYDLHAGHVTEELFFYGANWLIRPA
jgi:hypothetical protein